MDFARDDQLDKKTLALKKHAEWRGKLEINVKAPMKEHADLAIA